MNADFNGDDYADLAIDAPFEDVGTIENAGAVTVLYGTPTGLSAFGSQFWHQNVAGMEGDGAESSDHFGFGGLAGGDFDGDGFADLAIGTPFEDVEPDQAAGVVNVLYGSPAGLSIDGNQSWTQGSLGMDDFDTASEETDGFGNSLAAANFGKSNHADLAVGVTFEDMGAVSNAGALNVIYGSSGGLAMDGAQFWHQDSAGVVGDGVEQGDTFTFSLAAANFGQSNHADLAIGVASEDVGTIAGAGAVNVLYGSSTGLSASGDQSWHQNRPGVADAAEQGDAFGSALAAANFGNGSQADLAVGVTLENLGGAMDAGAVNVLYGSSTGLTASGDQFWHQNTPGVADAAEQSDVFGQALAAANFGGSSLSDLAIGAWSEDVGAKDAGAVNVLYGTSTGLTASGDQFWHQNSTGIIDVAEEFDSFGQALAAANFGKSSQSDLAVGASGESLGTITSAGAVNVIYGRSTGLNATGDQFWHQNVSGVAGDGAEQSDAFGGRLGAVR